MLQSILRNNFRAQIIIPVAIALLVMIVASIIFNVVMQNNSSETLNKQIETSFTEVDTLIKKDLGELSGQLGNNLQHMQEEVSTSLSKASSDSLQETAVSVQESLRNTRRMAGNNMTELMAMVATDAVIAKDFSALNAYVRSAHQNPETVFVFYLDKNQKPLTRFLNRKSEKLKSLLPKGRPDFPKIIQAAVDDPSILTISKDIKSDGDLVGSVTLAIDMTNARQQAQEMKEEFDSLVDDNSKLIDSILGKQATGIKDNLQTVINNINQAVTDNGSRTMTDVTTMGSKLSNKTRNLFILGSGLGFIMVLIILLLNARSVLKLLGGEPRAMLQMARRIADGDLRSDTKTNSVPGSLQEALQNMTENLRNLIGKIVNEGRVLSGTSTELALASEDMTGGAEQSASRANAVAAATEEMSANMGSVTMASEQAAQNVNIVATAMEEMTSAVQEIAQNTAQASSMTTDAVNYARSSTEKVNSLGTAAREISKVTEVITEISEQTNLLALNATIEAARAGEAGKGFAVVANEIKELAKQTAAATGEIKGKIDSIQSSTDATVTEITEISKVIDGVNEIVSTISAAVEEQSVTAVDISNNVNEAANGISEVNENVSQASGVAGEIARDIADVSQVSAEAMEGSLRLQESSQDLKQIAENINRETGHFELGDSKQNYASTRNVSTGRPLLRWTDSLSVGITSIDDQHKVLVDLINDLYQKMNGKAGKTATGNSLKKLIEYTKLHFKNEEKLFDQHNYPDKEAHKKSHRELVAQIVEFQEEFKVGKGDMSLKLMEFLKDWRVDHIKKADKKFSPFLKSKGVV